MKTKSPKPKITTVEQAIDLLNQCLDLSIISNAVEYLEQRALRYQLLSLYSHFFPQEYAESNASVYPCVEEDGNFIRCLYPVSDLVPINNKLTVNKAYK